MPTEAISIGPVWTLNQNQIYALPGVACILFTDAATPTFQQSNSLAFTNNVPVTLVGGAATVSGGWIRCTSGTVSVTLKRQ